MTKKFDIHVVVYGVNGYKVLQETHVYTILNSNEAEILCVAELKLVWAVETNPHNSCNNYCFPAVTF